MLDPSAGTEWGSGDGAIGGGRRRQVSLELGWDGRCHVGRGGGGFSDAMRSFAWMGSGERNGEGYLRLQRIRVGRLRACGKGVADGRCLALGGRAPGLG